MEILWAALGGFCLDLLLGDPAWMPHPVVLMGRCIEKMEGFLRKTFSNELLAAYAKRRRAKVVVKGLRAVSDFEQEVQMAVINRHLNPKLETMFLASSEKYTYLSSTIVKEMARYGANLADFVPREIVDDVNRRMREMEGKEG